MPELSTPNFDLSGRRALVTGASSGLGIHFAETLSAAGAEVILAARRVEKLEEVKAEIEQSGGVAHCIPLDVGDHVSVETAFAAIRDIDGRPCDVIVNNAGIVDGAWLIDASEEEWTRVINTNLNGVWRVVKYAANALIDASLPGSIVNVASIVGIRPMLFSSAYAASKAGDDHLTRVMALELARHKIRVNALAPGFIPTPLNDALLTSEAGEKMRKRIPMRRFGEAHDLDGALLLLASDAGAYMTGSTIVVDGGHTLTPL